VRLVAAGVGAFGGSAQAPRRGGGRIGLLGLAVLVAALGVLGFSAQQATAGVIHQFVGAFAAGSNPQALTADQATGDVFVIDVSAGQVLKFDGSGNPANFSALGTNVLDGATGAGATPHGAFAFDSPSAAQVAVDNSGGATDGYLYVASLAGVIDVFDSTGAWVGQIDGSAASSQSGGELCGVATDAAGDVYASYFSGHVDKYTPIDANPASDTFVGQLESVGRPCNVAADGSGNVYVSQWPNGPLTNYDASQLNQDSPTGTVVASSSTAVAVDPTSNEVYVDEGDHVAQFTSTGAPGGQSGSDHPPGDSRGVGIDGSTGDLYLADDTVGQVLHYGPGIDVPAPVVTIDPASNITTSHATFTGTVNPNGTDPFEDASWRFEYSLDNGATWTSTAGGDAGTGTTPVPVSDEVSTFLPDQAVEVRLVATNAANSVTSNVVSFTTIALPPDGATEQAQDITPSHAVLTGTLNAHHAPTTFFFEYGPTTAYGASIPAGQDADGGSSPDTIAVTQALYDLTPGTTYHYRVVAHNLAGTIHGADQTFTTTHPLADSTPRPGIPGAGILPDNRGWEQASPPVKHGADVMIDSARTRAAATETPSDPMAATFSSLGGFADVHGTGTSNDYMTLRTGQAGTSGWSTHGITPPQKPVTFRGAFKTLESQWENEFSPDLSQGIFRSWTALTNDPNVNDVENLYRRDDLRTPGLGVYQLLTACPLCTAPLPAIEEFGQIPSFAGASTDFTHVIFESTYPLVAASTADSGNPNLYEWDNGALRLVGILPDSACVTPPCVAPTSIAGVGTGAGGGVARFSPHAISADGSRIIFTDPSTGIDPFSGNLYMRLNGTMTIQVNASEKTPADPSQPATFQTASTDGTRVFFTTNEQLTSAPTNGTVDLYMYDTTALAGHHLTLISAGHSTEDDPNGVPGVIGASANGHYVYFLAGGQLVAGQPVLRNLLGIYEWHDGVTSYIGKLANLNATNDKSFAVLPNFWVGGPMAARVTPDGKHMLFQSSSGDGLTGYQSNRNIELYLYSADQHELQCVSCRPDGTRAGGGASDMSRTFTGSSTTTSHLSRAITDDGSKVFFTSTDSLVSRDTNGKSDVYEFDTASGTVHLLSAGTDNANSYFMDASANGADVFFVTHQQLVTWDQDQSYDLYDARVNGGLPDLPTSSACVGDGCHGLLALPPDFIAPATQTVQGEGNVKPRLAHNGKRRGKRVKCRHSFMRKRVRGRVRCVRTRKPGRHVKRAVQR
jgi:hypothetical protein